MQHIELKGSNYAIGFQIGHWWGQFLLSHPKQYICRSYLRSYNQWTDSAHKKLLKSCQRFPDILREIQGMADGAKVAGLPIPFRDMFVLCLGETEGPIGNCSSIVVRDDQGFLLAHNEEEDDIYPLLMTTVMPGSGRNGARTSVSYPFQLLGSVAGANQSFAFQGNSIGCNRQGKALRESPEKRIPKTFLTRKLLDQSSIAEVLTLFKNHHCTLPTHHFVVFHDAAYSIEIRPVEDTRGHRGNEVTVHQITDRHMHTNHFQANGGFDAKWRWKYRGAMDCSAWRLDFMKRRLGNGRIDTGKLKRILHDIRLNEDYSLPTSASLIFSVRKEKIDLDVKSYFDPND